MEDIKCLIETESSLKLKEKLLTSLGEEFAGILEGALKYSLHPTLEDAIMELSRSELLFISLLQALGTKNVLMSLRLLQEVENWSLLPRISAYMGGKLNVEFNCMFELIKEAGDFIHALEQSGFMKIPKKVINYIDFLHECAKKDLHDEAVEVNDSSSEKQPKRRGKKRRRRSDKRAPSCEIVEVPQLDYSEPATVYSSTQSEVIPTLGLTSSESVTVCSSSQTVIVPNALGPLESATACSSSQTEAVQTIEPSSFCPRLPTTSNSSSQPQTTDVAQAQPIASSSSSNYQVCRSGNPFPYLPGSGRRFQRNKVFSTDHYPPLLHTPKLPLPKNFPGPFPPLPTEARIGPLQKVQWRRGGMSVKKATNLLCQQVAINSLSGIQCYLALGADVRRKDFGGSTPLHFAALEGFIEAIDLLLRAGAPVEAANIQGNRPLHLAAMRGKDEAVAWLVAVGADIHAVGEGGRTPEQWAFEGGYDFTADYIRALGQANK